MIEIDYWLGRYCSNHLRRERLRRCQNSVGVQWVRQKWRWWKQGSFVNQNTTSLWVNRQIHNVSQSPRSRYREWDLTSFITYNRSCGTSTSHREKDDTHGSLYMYLVKNIWQALSRDNLYGHHFRPLDKSICDNNSHKTWRKWIYCSDTPLW